jgi:nitrate/TMAO reductase-like tetraheme cytochrome c subunit
MNFNEDRPVLAILTSHWLSMVGALITTMAGCAWLLMLPSQVRGHASNPYVGIVGFLLLPFFFIIGLVLMAIGVWLSRRSIREGHGRLLTRKESLKRIGIFVVIATILNLVIVSQLSYGAVKYMEEAQFCGQSCHVMKPEFSAYQVASHARVLCVECHVTPGAVGWVQSKMSGTRQLIQVILNNYPRPIKSAIETDRLVPTAGTCESCHWAGRFGGAQVKVIPEYADDEANTSTQTVLTMMVGGGHLGGIHGAHLGPGVSIRYAAADPKRQTIPWVEYRNTTKNESRTFVAEGSNAADIAKLPTYAMQCVDCHNRPAHTFESPERAMNRAMAAGEIPVSLPFIKKKGLEVLKATYASNDDAAQQIPTALKNYYASAAPSRSEDVDAAAKAIVALYNQNVFPDLKVTWGTYANNLGHTDFPGCFRCHDAAHTAEGGKAINQDCDSCHQIVAASEASPEVLKTLGVEERISALQRK